MQKILVSVSTNTSGAASASTIVTTNISLPIYDLSEFL